MPDLNFQIERAEAVPFAAVPTLSFKLRVENGVTNETIHSVALRAQIQIDANRRRYNETEKKKLLDLFGEPERWSRTLRPMLWTHANLVMPSFIGATATDLQVPCSFDFNVAATKYFHAIADGDIPLNFLFSGTVFYAPEGSELLVNPISWDKETRFRLPIQVWREMMDHYYPNVAWLQLRRDVFEQVYEYKVGNGLQTWEAVFQHLLEMAGAVAR